MTDTSNYGTLSVKTVEANTIKASLDGGEGDLVLQANNLPSDGSVVFSTLHYNAATPTYSFSLNTQVKGVKDPTLDQDAATKKYVDDNAGGGGGTPGPGTTVAFAASFNSGNDAGTTFAVGGQSGIGINVWDLATLTVDQADPNFTYNAISGLLQYTGTTTIRTLVTAQFYGISDGVDNKLLEFTLVQNAATARQEVRGRLADSGKSVTSYTVQYPVEFDASDTVKLLCKCVTHGTATTDIQCQSMTITVYAGVGSRVGDLPEQITVGDDVDLEIYHDPSHGVGGANVIDSKTGDLLIYNREAGKDIDFKLTNDANTNFTIKNIQTGQNLMIINAFNKVTSFYYRVHSEGDFSVTGIFSDTVGVAGNALRTVNSNTGLQYTATHLGYKLIRRTGTPGGAITDTLPNGATITGAFEGSTCPAGSMFTLTILPDFEVTLDLGTDLQWVGGSTVSPTYGSDILVADKMNIVHFTNLTTDEFAVYIQN